MLAVLLESFAKPSGEYGFFFSGFDPIAEDDEGNSGDAAPAVNRQDSADGSQIESGIDGMPEIGVGAGADELVIFFESDSGAPILSEMPARPEGKGNADPCEGNASEGKSVGAGENAIAENAYASPAEKLEKVYYFEKQDKADYFQEENTVTRYERFAADGAARLERACHPIDDKDNPRNLDQQ